MDVKLTMAEKHLCPKCQSPMKNGLAPCRVKGRYIGRYDAMICTVCKHYLFTAKDYDKILNQSIVLGLIGLPPSVRILRTNQVAPVTEETKQISEIKPPTVTDNVAA